MFSEESTFAVITNIGRCRRSSYDNSYEKNLAITKVIYKLGKRKNFMISISFGPFSWPCCAHRPTSMLTECKHLHLIYSLLLYISNIVYAAEKLCAIQKFLPFFSYLHQNITLNLKDVIPKSFYKVLVTTSLLTKNCGPISSNY